MATRKRPELPSTRSAPSILDQLTGKAKDVVALSAPFDPATVRGTAEQRLAEFERIVNAAKGEAERSLRQARDRFVLVAGPIFHAINTEDLYKTAENPDRTFDDYMWETFGYKRSYVYQCMELVPVVAALSAIADTDPEEVRPEHLKVVGPVLKQHGEEATREVWKTAKAENGRVTGAALKRARETLGYVVEIPKQATGTAGASGDPESGANTKQDEEETSPVVLLGRVVNSLNSARRSLNRSTIAAAFEEDAVSAEQHLADINSRLASLTRLAKKP